MTLFFVTNYDTPTSLNHAIAMQIIEDADTSLMGIAAIRENLLIALQDNPTSNLFAMSHGTSLHITDNQTIPALTDSDSQLLAGRSVFAFACLTAVTLGLRMASQEVHWWGYDALITAPSEDPTCSRIQAQVFAEARRAFEATSTAHDVVVALNNIRDACEEALAALDEHSDRYCAADYFCLHQIWQRLSVCFVGIQIPLRHPNAPAPYIEI